MRVVVTGTPGTGKTTTTDLVESSLRVIHLNAVIESNAFISGVDRDRDSWIADLEAVKTWYEDLDDVLVESHLAHHLPADQVIVLRCHPDSLEQRLIDRGESARKARENAESEALDLILSEAVASHGPENVFEIDTTTDDPRTVAEEIMQVINGDREPAVGIVSFGEYLV